MRINYDLSSRAGPARSTWWTATPDIGRADAPRQRTSGRTARACARSPRRSSPPPAMAATLRAVLRSPDGFVWLPQGGAKREVPDPRVLTHTGSARLDVRSAQVLAQLRLGRPSSAQGLRRSRGRRSRHHGRRADLRAFPRPVASEPSISSAWKISAASVDLLTVEGDLPTRVIAGPQSYVLTGGRLARGESRELCTARLRSIGARATEGIRLGGIGARGRTSCASRVRRSCSWPLAGSALWPTNARAWIAATYGVPGKVWVVADGALR